MINEDRMRLHQILKGALDPTGRLNNVYYQPPESIKMQYPAIVYRRSKIQNEYGDNIIYKNKVRYEITVIDYDPDSSILERMFSLRYCEHDRHYAQNNLNHDVFTLYF